MTRVCCQDQHWAEDVTVVVLAAVAVAFAAAAAAAVAVAAGLPVVEEVTSAIRLSAVAALVLAVVGVGAVVPLVAGGSHSR